MIDLTNVKDDDRPARGGWAPGAYVGMRCRECCDAFMGAKRTWMCADCAYALPDPEADLDIRRKAHEAAAGDADLYVGGWPEAVAAIEGKAQDSPAYTAALVACLYAWEQRAAAGRLIVKLAEMENRSDRPEAVRIGAIG